MFSRNRIVIGSVLALAIVQLACGSTAGTTPTPTLLVPTTEAEDTGGESKDPLTAEPTGELTAEPTEDFGTAPTEEVVIEPTTEEDNRPYVDPCTLVTVEEAAGILGEGATVDESGIGAAFGTCIYYNADMTSTFSVAANQGDDAREIFEFAGLLTDDPEIQASYAGIADEFYEMPVTELLTIYATEWIPETGYEVEEVAGYGEVAYWMWNPNEATGLLALAFGETYVALQTNGPPEAISRPALEALVETVLGRLPESFTTTAPEE